MGVLISVREFGNTEGHKIGFPDIRRVCTFVTTKTSTKKNKNKGTGPNRYGMIKSQAKEGFECLNKNSKKTHPANSEYRYLVR